MTGRRREKSEPGSEREKARAWERGKLTAASDPSVALMVGDIVVVEVDP